jgi:alkylhydroperoxidase family enzyme
MPVIPLKDPSEMEPEIQQMVKDYDAWIGDTVYARFMAHNPEVFKKFNDFYAFLLGGSVESEIKELARLRLARLNDCDY